MKKNPHFLLVVGRLKILDFELASKLVLAPEPALGPLLVPVT